MSEATKIDPASILFTELLRCVYEAATDSNEWTAVPAGIRRPRSNQQKMMSCLNRRYNGISKIPTTSAPDVFALPNTTDGKCIDIPRGTISLVIPDTRAATSRMLEVRGADRRSTVQQLTAKASTDTGIGLELRNNLRRIAFISDSDSHSDEPWAQSPLHDAEARFQISELADRLSNDLEIHWVCAGPITVPDESPAKLIIHSDSSNIPDFSNLEVLAPHDSSVRWEVFSARGLTEDQPATVARLQNFGRNIGRAAADGNVRTISISVSGRTRDFNLAKHVLEAAPIIRNRLEDQGYEFSVFVNGKVAFGAGVSQDAD